MGPISGVNERQTDSYLLWGKRVEQNASKVRMQRADEKTQDSQDVKEKKNNPAEEVRNVSSRRMRDEYIPEIRKVSESDKISGEKNADGNKPPESDKVSKRAESEKSEMYRGSTDKVDREIEKLKRRKTELESKLSMEKDERKIQELEKQLSQVERELSQKDNDTYRKQHMEMTKM